MTNIEKAIQAERDPEVMKAKLNLETAQINWLDLQRYFAAGSVISVDSELDLTDVGLAIALDDKQKVESWMASGLVGQVNDQQAATWFEHEAVLWACVVKPWVLVQER